MDPEEVAVSDEEDSLNELRGTPAGWSLEQELEIAAEVYGPDPKGHVDATGDLTDEELVELFRSILGFDVNWE
jgi:hypothetical protein